MNKNNNINKTKYVPFFNLDAKWLNWFVGFCSPFHYKKYDVTSRQAKTFCITYKTTRWISSMANRSNTNLSLVLWGTNLTSSVGLGKFTKQVSNMLKLPSYQKSVIIGIILSDGWIIVPVKGRINARLGFKQAVVHSNYVWHAFGLLSHYCNRMRLI